MSTLVATVASTVPEPTSAKRDQLTVGDPALAERVMEVDDMAFGISLHVCAVELGEPRFTRDVERRTAKSTRLPRLAADRAHSAAIAPRSGGGGSLRRSSTWPPTCVSLRPSCTSS